MLILNNILAFFFEKKQQRKNACIGTGTCIGTGRYFGSICECLKAFVLRSQSYFQWYKQLLSIQT